MKTSFYVPCLAVGLLLAAEALAGEGKAMAPVSGDAEAIAVLSAVNEHEVQAALIAKGKRVSPAVLDYANKMSREHGANQAQTDQLKRSAALVASETDAVRALKEKSGRERARLSGLEGKAFEDAYVDAMVKDHSEVLTRLDKQLLPAATNPAVAAHLRKTREHVAHHLEEARRLDGQAHAQTDPDD